MVPARNMIKHPIMMFYSLALNNGHWCEALRTNKYRFYEINHFTLKMSLIILLRREFGIGSGNNLLNDIFLYSHHFSARYCVEIVRRNSFLVTHRYFRSIPPSV